MTKYTAAYLVNGPEALADGGDFFTGFITSNAELHLDARVHGHRVRHRGPGREEAASKANLFMMPALIIIAVAIAILRSPCRVPWRARCTTSPDFGKFSPELVIGALGRDVLQPVAGHGHHDHLRLLHAQAGIASPHRSCVSAASILGVSFIAGLLIVSAAFVAMGSGDAVAARRVPRSCS